MSGAETLGRGRWSEPGVPHKGWSCVAVEDAGEDDGDHETCGMCLSTKVRFIHVMIHGSHDETLRVGCVCAGHMSGDYEGAKAREKPLKKKAQKARLDRQLLEEWGATPDELVAVRKFSGNGWKVTRKGNHIIQVAQWRFIILDLEDCFKIGVVELWREPHPVSWKPGAYYPLNDAKKACLHTYRWAVQRRRGRAPV